MKKIVFVLSMVWSVCANIPAEIHQTGNPHVYDAQHKLSGRIIDKQNQAISAVTIRILDVDSIFIVGGVTDDNGVFQLNGVKEGNYILAVSCIGYINLFLNIEIPQTDYELPAIVLEEDNVMLEGVTVTGSSFIQKKDHLLVIPDKQTIKHAFGGYDLLYNLMIPGLTVDRKKKTVTSIAGGATLYINGVEADMREIQALQPKDIERIEYYTLPTSGIFAGDAASVNYITKTYKTGGYITLDGEQTVGYTKGDYNVASKIAHENTSYTFFGGYNMKAYDGVEIEKNEELFLQDYTINRNTANEGAKYRGNQQYAQFKVNNDAKKHNLSALASFVRDATPHDDRNELLSYTGNENLSTQSTDKNNDESLKGSINLNGTFHVNEQQFWKVRLNGAYTKNKYNRSYTEGEQLSLSNADEDLYSFDAQVAYNYQPNKNNIFYGRITHFHNITSSHYSGDYTSWQHLWKGESMFQLDYTHLFSEKIITMVGPGVSWLNYKLHGQEHQ